MELNVNATFCFNNVSVILWWSVLLIEETRAPRENHQPAASHWQASVVYGHGQNIICGESMQWIYRKWHHRKWRHRKSRARKRPWPEVIVCACATGIWAIPALVGPFDRKWRHQTSPVVTGSHVTQKGVPLGVCMRNFQVAQYLP
jgi:hypothetical protein